MDKRHKSGEKAETLAQNYLKNQGFELLIKNFRYKKAEIDLIMKMDDLLLFIEVKFRSRTDFGYPEESVSENQKQLIRTAATYYMEKLDWKGNVRFDIIAIDSQMKVTHFEDAF